MNKKEELKGYLFMIEHIYSGYWRTKIIFFIMMFLIFLLNVNLISFINFVCAFFIMEQVDFIVLYPVGNIDKINFEEITDETINYFDKTIIKMKLIIMIYIIVQVVTFLCS